MKNRSTPPLGCQVIPSHCKAAFSLIELLVVIAIVAVLSAVTVPAITSARRAALEAKSLGQLRQIGVAMHAYANDHQLYFPLGYFYGQVENRWVEKTYVSELLPYMGLPPRFYQNEDNPFIAPTSVVPVRSGVSAGFTPFTYSVHGLLCGDISKGDRRIKRSAVARPSEVILVADGPQLSNTFATANFSNPPEFALAGRQTDLDTPIPIGPDTDVQGSRGFLRYRNRGKVAALMVDGHTELLGKGKVRYRHVIADR